MHHCDNNNNYHYHNNANIDASQYLANLYVNSYIHNYNRHHNNADIYDSSINSKHLTNFHIDSYYNNTDDSNDILSYNDSPNCTNDIVIFICSFNSTTIVNRIDEYNSIYRKRNYFSAVCTINIVDFRIYIANSCLSNNDVDRYVVNLVIDECNIDNDERYKFEIYSVERN